MGRKRTTGGSGTASEAETDPYREQILWSRGNFQPQPPEFNLDDDFEAWGDKMERFLRYEEPRSRSHMVMRNLAAPARRIVVMSGCSDDTPYEQLLEKLSTLFSKDAESILQKLVSRRYRSGERVDDYMAEIHDLVRRTYPGSMHETLTVTHVLRGLPDKIALRHAGLITCSIADVQKALTADPELGDKVQFSTPAQPSPVLQWRQKTNVFQGPRSRGPGGQWTGKPRGGEGSKKPPGASVPCPAIHASCADTRPFISIGVCNRLMHFLVDTGAGCSLVNPRRFPQKMFDPYLVASSINVKAANGTVMCSKGCVDIALTITGSVYQHTLYLCHDMPYDGILESDFLDRYDGEYSRPHRCLRLGSQEVPVVYEQSNGAISAITTQTHPTPDELDLLVSTKAHSKGLDLTQLRKLVQEYADVFAWEGADTGRTNGALHDIHTTEVGIIRQRPRRIPVAYQQAVEEAIVDMLQKKIIKPSSSH
ncbi:unnamed protein product [Mesocestoides corti]|uniref:Peptidase A2 domain-containing protein n=1 Tax=Mesocestoides corti TaxID=53468 RepID=A0A0R3UCE6_MESCO|nr:unnamed protein product [Mesocestoides corti]